MVRFSIHVFISILSWRSIFVYTQETTLERSFAACYDDCNYTLRIADRTGMVPALCQQDSEFNLALKVCAACLETISKDQTEVARFAYTDVGPFISYCQQDFSSSYVGKGLVTTTTTGTGQSPTFESTLPYSVPETFFDSVPTDAETFSSMPANSASSIRLPPTVSTIIPQPSYNCSNSFCMGIIEDWNVFFRVSDVFRDYSGCLSLNTSSDISAFRSCANWSCPASRSIPQKITGLFTTCIQILDDGVNESNIKVYKEEPTANVQHAAAAAAPLSKERIVGICLGSVFALIIACSILFWLLRTRRRKLPEPPSNSVEPSELCSESLKPKELGTDTERLEIGSSVFTPSLLDGKELPAEMPG